MRVIFMGSAPIAVPSLRWLHAHQELAGVVTQPDRPQGRKKILAPTAVKVAARELGLDPLEPRRLKAPEFGDALRALRPDVIVVMAYGRLVPPAVLSLPPHGCINLHGSILPKYRGPCPIERAVIDGEKITGITTFYMDERFDEGDVILSREMPIAKDDSAGSVREKMGRFAVEVLSDTLDQVERGVAPRLPQDPAAGSHAPIVTREEARVDWSRDAGRIDCLVRGCDPEPGAWTEFRGQPLKIRRVRGVDGDGMPPGSLRVVDRRPLVGAGAGTAAWLEEVQPAGKRWMSGAEFAAGYRPTEGERLT